MNGKVKTVRSAWNAVSGSARGVLVRMGRSASLAAGVLLLGGALLLGGCSKESEELPAGTSEGEELVKITLTPESMGDVLIDSRSMNGVDEHAVKDLWIIQLNSAGTARLRTPQYITSITSSGSSCSVTAKIMSKDCRLYFIANTGNPTLYKNVGTDDDICNAWLSDISDESSLSRVSGTLPMSGYFSGTPTVWDLNNIALKRAVAKLTVKLAVDLPSDAGGSSFALTSVKVKNVPACMQYFRNPSKLNPATTDDCYPSLDLGSIVTWADLTPSDKTLSATAKNCGWCYLPENARGTGTATDQKDKTADTALGGAGGQGDAATYIEITGDYTSYLGTYTNCVYKIYLGKNNYNNYDVLRNTHYTVTATIKGINELDARITLGPVSYSGDFCDYTENGTGRFVYAKSDDTDGSWQAASIACAKTPGWRLPTLTELEIMYCMRDSWSSRSNGFSPSDYWAAWVTSSGSVWSMDFGDGELSVGSKNINYCVRCVRSL